MMNAFPVGLDIYTSKPYCVDFTKTTTSLLLYGDESSASETVINETLALLPEIKAVFDPAKKLSRKVQGRLITAEKIEKYVMSLWQTAQERATILRNSKNNGTAEESFEDYYILICEYAAVLDVLSDEAAQYLGAMICGLNEKFCIHFIISARTEDCERLKREEALLHALPFKNGILVGGSESAEEFFGIPKNDLKEREKDRGICVSDNKTHRVMFIT